MPVAQLSELFTESFIKNDVLISGIAIDSRQVGKDYLFCAIEGESLDGHEYIDMAISAGANAIATEREITFEKQDIACVYRPQLRSELGMIASRFYSNPTATMYVVGVTGTNGKTTVASLVQQLMNAGGKSCGYIGTLGIQFSDKSIDTVNTTPDAISMQSQCYEMKLADISAVAIEVSSHALIQQRCSAVQFDSVIFTNITNEHLDYHKTFESYLDAKTKLFTEYGAKIAIINIDDPSAEHLIALLPSTCKVLSFSLNDKDADMHFSSIQPVSGGYQVDMVYLDEQASVLIPLTGLFNLYNVMAAMLAVISSGERFDHIVSLVSELKSVAGRMEMVENSFSINAIVDYAHTPDALENVLKTLSVDCKGRVIAVFGCGGDRDRHKRSVMGSIADKYADYSIVTSDNPRSEDPAAINTAIISGIVSQDYEVIEDRRQAITRAVNMAEAGDVILVAGKGHETYQLIGYESFPFDDVEVLKNAFSEREGWS